MSAVSTGNRELALMNQSFIVPKYISAPYTTIQNRAQVLDASNMLQAVMGVERIPFRGINLLQKEFGVNGEQVWELESKDARVRFVGSTWLGTADANGTRAIASAIGDYSEFIFYGTGLNIVTRLATGAGDLRVTIDNGSEGASVIPASLSNVLATRNYAANQILNIASSLTLGWHFIKVRNNTVSENFHLHGIEVLNQSSSISIPPGQAFIGNRKDSLAVLTTSAYNAGFSGTKGGRVSKYLLNGAISQVIRECAATPSYLTNANHADEEVVRRINFREFGANRADDFSTVTTVRAAAFTLDDGTTTLAGDSVAGDNVATGFLSHNSNSNFFTITFIGTGLDIIRKDSAAGGSDTYTIFIDGTSQGTLNSTGSTSIRTEKICSGLAYGTHTIKVVRTSAATFSVGVSDFIIYQPKAPTLPIGAILVADYNVMANYVANSTGGAEYIAQGTLRKMGTRELTYVGSFVAALSTLGGTTGSPSGWIIGASAAANISYYFYGTGFEMRITNPGATALNATLAIDSSSNLSSFTTSVYGTGVAITASTGVVTAVANSLYSSGVTVSGLALGWHKVVYTYNSGSYFDVEAFDIITPIHINHPTLKIGSLSLLDNTKINALALPVTGPDLSKAKAWLRFDAATNKILGSVNISQVLNVGTGQWNVYFSKPFKNAYYTSIGSVENSSRFVGGDSTLKTPSKCIVSTQTTAGTFVSDSVWCVEFLGELIDE